MSESTKWLTSDLRDEVKLLFESRYGRQIDDMETINLATSLTEYMETVIKWKMQHEQTATRSTPAVPKA